MSNLEAALKRVNALKTLAQQIVGRNNENAGLIKTKLDTIKSKIVKLKELRINLKRRFELLSAQTGDVQKIVAQTQDIDAITTKLQELQAQIAGLRDLDVSDLDTTISELEGLLRDSSGTGSGSGSAPSSGSGSASGATAQPAQPSATSSATDTTRAISRIRERPGSSRPPMQGGYRYDSTAKSKSKSRRSMRSKTRKLKSKRSSADKLKMSRSGLRSRRR